MHYVYAIFHLGKRKADESMTAPAKKAKVEEEGAAAGESSTVFVGRLSWNVDNDWLSSEFAGCGTVVSARVQMDRNTGKSRGFGYVEFSSPAEAQKAVAEMNGKQIDSREINVDISLPRQPNPEKRAQVFGDSESEPSTTLFVGNLAWTANEDTIWAAFGDFGDIVHVRLPTDQESGKPKGFGYVEFSDQASATKAYQAMKGKDLEGRTIRLDYSQPRDKQGGGGRGGFGGRGGGRGFGGDRGGRGGGRGGFGDRGGRGGRGRGGFGDRGGRGRGGRGGGARTGGIAEFKGNKMTFD